MLRTANNYRSVFARCANAKSESNFGAYKVKTGGRPREYDYDNADVCLTCDNPNCTGTAACMAKRKRMLGK